MHQNKSLPMIFAEWWDRRSERSHEHTYYRSFHWLPTPGTVIFTLLVIGGLLWAQNVGAISLSAPSAASTSITGIPYQGRLADKNGAPLTQTVNMTFRLYAVASGGVPLWEEPWTGANSVQVSDGLFNVMLGSITPISQAVITGNSNLFLGITVGTDREMSPRVQLGSVPFATQALTVPDGSITKAKLASNLFEVKRASTTTSPYWQLPACGGSTNNADSDTGYAKVPGLALGFAVSETQTILVNFSGLGGNNSSTGSIFTNIFVDGARSTVANGRAAISGCRNSSADNSATWCTLSNSTIISLTPGSHTIDIRAVCDPGGTAIIWGGAMWSLALP